MGDVVALLHRGFDFGFEREGGLAMFLGSRLCQYAILCAVAALAL